MNTGKNIYDIRTERKMSQEEFGKLLHVTRQTVSNWELEKSYPDLETLIKISDLFSVSLDLLMKEDREMVRRIDRQRRSGKRWRIVVIVLVAAVFVSAVAISRFLSAYDPTPQGERNLRIDRQRRSGKRWRIVVIVLVAAVFVSAVAISRFLSAYDPTPQGERNLSNCDAAMFLDIEDPGMRRSIVRTFDRNTFENFGQEEMQTMRNAIGGTAEGDIPCILLEKNSVVRPVFQIPGKTGAKADVPPEFRLHLYNSQFLPSTDHVPESEKKNMDGIEKKAWSGRLSEDRKGYYLDLKELQGIEHFCADFPDGGVCYLELRFSVRGKAWSGRLSEDRKGYYLDLKELQGIEHFCADFPDGGVCYLELRFSVRGTQYVSATAFSIFEE